jgi:hypothetical protein
MIDPGIGVALRFAHQRHVIGALASVTLEPLM